MLSRAYGSLASEVLSLAEREPALLDPVAAQAGLLGAQVVYAREREWALTAEDVLRRRTALSLTGRVSPELHAGVDRLLARGVALPVGRP